MHRDRPGRGRDSFTGDPPDLRLRGLASARRRVDSRSGDRESLKLASRQPKLSPKVRSSECRVWIVSAVPIGSPNSTTPPSVSGLDLLRRPVAEHHRPHGQLVEQRLERVGDAEAGRRVEIAAGRRTRDRSTSTGRRSQLSARSSTAAPSGSSCPAPSRCRAGRAARRLESRAELELAAGHPVQAAEVEVVAARRQAGRHRVEVDPVAGRVDEHVAALEGASEGSRSVGRSARVGERGARLAARREATRRARPGPRRGRAAAGRRPRPTRPGRARSPARSSRRLRGRPHAVPGADRRRSRGCRRIVHATSSLARSASQSSIRSVARDRSRPVSSSILRIR